MNILDVATVTEIFQKNKEPHISGRWIRFKDIAPLLEKHALHFERQEIGSSEDGRPIYSFQLGTGKKKILVWTQMHGNESTGTKALFDLLNVMSAGATTNTLVATIVKECTLLCVPMLNPDGAEQYTRVNGRNIDLNRDAVSREAKESKLLRHVLETFKPEFCFNLHDQRTIFGVEGTKNPATLSFLAPSEEVSRAITSGRKQTMNVIVAMNTLLQQVIPNHIGRYTDEFYPTATGDNFQKLGYNCILIESGHFYKDYVREKSREFTFYSLLQGIYHIASATSYEDYEAYFNIPNNVELFFDEVDRSTTPLKAYQYKEAIIDGNFTLNLEIIQHFDDNQVVGHNEIDFEI